MIPASHPATSSPPKRGETRTTRPAAISTMCIASAALPGMMLHDARRRLRTELSAAGWEVR